MNTIYHQTVKVLKNELEGANLWRIRCASREIAEAVKPGQFCMLRIPGVRAPLLGRPLAIFRADVVEGTGTVEVVYAVVGKGTEQLSHFVPGQEIEIWGPLGNGFPLDENVTRPLLLAGGIGQTPMFLTAKAFLKRPQTEKVTLLWGGRSRAHLACLADFQALATQYPGRLEILNATDDGSYAHHGFVTDLQKEQLASGLYTPENCAVYACGPRPMLRAVAQLAEEAGVKCWVSLETPMACGMGICFTCVTKCKDDTSPEGWDYCRTCTEGPVFDADKLLWE